MSSIAAGIMPAAMISLIALVASSTVLKIARKVRWSCGSGVRRTQTLVTIASVPSLPTSTPIRSNPAGFSTGPSRRIEPSPSTASRPSTWFTVTPYFRVCGPPALVATLPPMVEATWLDGSGAKWNPEPARARPSSTLGTPASTTARRLSRSTWRIRFIRVSSTTTPPPIGRHPPARLVPAPRGTIGTPRGGWRS